MENTKTTFRPILFSTPMVQAILENRKKLTRRTKGLEKVNKNPDDWKFEAFGKNPDNEKDKRLCAYFTIKGTETWFYQICPYNIGDVFWVRETFTEWPEGCFQYRASTAIGNELGKWKPSIFMPKEACRIFLRLNSIRVERLQEISTDDIIKEGVRIPVSNKWNGNNKVVFKLGMDNSALSFLPNGCMAEGAPKLHQNQLLNAFWAELWCKINGRASWDLNPFVFVYEFEQIEKPLDFIV